MKSPRRMKKNAAPKSAQLAAFATASHLDQVFGGALNAYMTLTGETQGEIKGSETETQTETECTPSEE